MNLWLPNDPHKDVRERKRAEVDALARSADICKRFTRELREIDPLLEMRQVKERSPHPRMKPGQYIIVRHNEGAPPSIILVKDEEGNAIEPDSRVFDQLLGMDLWKDDGLRELRKRREKAEAAKKREEKRRREERAERIDDMAKAKWNPGVSMANRGNWTYRAGARKG